MQTFKVTLVFEVQAEDFEDARVLAYEMSQRANDSVDGDVGECTARTAEVM